MPYGEKTKEKLLEYSSHAFEFFEQQGVKAVIMACNTTSAMVYEELKDKYDFKLYPLIQSVSKILAELPIQNIGIFATPATINSHAYFYGIKNYNQSINVFEIACPEWVKIVENNTKNSEEAKRSIQAKMEEMLKNNIERIILGCTHYPYLLKELSEYAPENIFINPSQSYVNFIKEDLKSLGLLNQKETKGYDKFFVSANPEKFIKAAKMFYTVMNCNLL